MKRKSKVVALVLSVGSMLPMFGCLGQYFNWIVQGLPGTVIAEWLLDNDSIFDLFEDGNVAAAQ